MARYIKDPVTGERVRVAATGRDKPVEIDKAAVRRIQAMTKADLPETAKEETAKTEEVVKPDQQTAKK